MTGSLRQNILQEQQQTHGRAWRHVPWTQTGRGNGGKCKIWIHPNISYFTYPQVVCSDFICRGLEMYIFISLTHYNRGELIFRKRHWKVEQQHLFSEMLSPVKVTSDMIVRKKIFRDEKVEAFFITGFNATYVTVINYLDGEANLPRWGCVVVSCHWSLINIRGKLCPFCICTNPHIQLVVLETRS